MSLSRLPAEGVHAPQPKSSAKLQTCCCCFRSHSAFSTQLWSQQPRTSKSLSSKCSKKENQVQDRRFGAVQRLFWILWSRHAGSAYGEHTETAAATALLEDTGPKLCETQDSNAFNSPAGSKHVAQVCAEQPGMCREGMGPRMR